MFSCIDLGHLAAQHALSTVTEAAVALLLNESSTNLLGLFVTIVIQVLLQVASSNTDIISLCFVMLHFFVNCLLHVNWPAS